ncbi:hypothetical protein OMAG_002849 [Candidatus Omnitrophus magneticus]|uniref:Uncharacterized protein n=1 Tax=Candidatus Omnitrophus magneticus TaxID=1609969 RepID=A0A0F0CMQ8_9BACT|nr:hypothetical protein OMAG_002849 [Candidatus Omnitrophus magneticus]
MTVSICSIGIFCLDKILRISPSRVSNAKARSFTISKMFLFSSRILSLSCSIVFRKSVSSLGVKPAEMLPPPSLYTDLSFICFIKTHLSSFLFILSISPRDVILNLSPLFFPAQTSTKTHEISPSFFGWPEMTFSIGPSPNNVLSFNNFSINPCQSKSAAFMF